MNRGGSERCIACGAPALVRMQGDTLCARCGLERSSRPNEPTRRGGRAVLLGLLSSGFLAKMLIGAAAVAAIGGAATGISRVTPDPGIARTTTTSSIVETEVPASGLVAPGTAVNVVAEPPASEELVERALAYVTEVETWGECVSLAAREHSGEGLDPKEECGEMPAASDLDLEDEKTADKIAKTEDKATKDDEKTADKILKTEDKVDPSDEDE